MRREFGVGVALGVLLLVALNVAIAFTLGAPPAIWAHIGWTCFAIALAVAFAFLIEATS